MSNRVIAAVVERGGRFLICRRPAHKHHGNLWEFPGGKLEPGESLPDAARRELQEELDLEVVSVGRTRLEVTDNESGYVIVFVDVDVRGNLQLLEHQEFAWVTIEQLVKLPLAPSDRTFAEHLAHAQS